jgi:cytochrome c-type biogenesis protein CcmH
MRALALILMLLGAAGAALAVEPGERLADPAQEARARALGSELRCLVCQNQSIDESNADLAHDLRVLIRERISAGDSDPQVLRFMVSRYGDFILLRPPVKPATYVLWASPFAVLLLGAAAAALYYRRRRRAPETAAPLSPEEQRRLQRLLAEGTER